MRRLVICCAVIMLTLPAGMCQTRFVKVPCVTKQQYEDRKKAKPGKIRDRLTGKADQDIKPITGQLIRMESWGDGLLGVLEDCTG